MFLLRYNTTLVLEIHWHCELWCDHHHLVGLVGWSGRRFRVSDRCLLYEWNFCRWLWIYSVGSWIFVTQKRKQIRIHLGLGGFSIWCSQRVALERKSFSFYPTIHRGTYTDQQRHASPDGSGGCCCVGCEWLRSDVFIRINLFQFPSENWFQLQ